MTSAFMTEFISNVCKLNTIWCANLWDFFWSYWHADTCVLLYIQLQYCCKLCCLLDGDILRLKGHKGLFTTLLTNLLESDFIFFHFKSNIKVLVLLWISKMFYYIYNKYPSVFFKIYVIYGVQVPVDVGLIMVAEGVNDLTF